MAPPPSTLSNLPPDQATTTTTSANASPHHRHHHTTLVRSSTLPTLIPRSHRSDPSHLSPEDAFVSASPPRRPGLFDGGNGSGSELGARRMRPKDTSRSRSRRRKRFQKLLWVTQSCTYMHASRPGRC